jgi:hypothetical protein
MSNLSDNGSRISAVYYNILPNLEPDTTGHNACVCVSVVHLSPPCEHKSRVCAQARRVCVPRTPCLSWPVGVERHASGARGVHGLAFMLRFTI